MLYIDALGYMPAAFRKKVNSVDLGAVNPAENKSLTAVTLPLDFDSLAR